MSANRPYQRRPATARNQRGNGDSDEEAAKPRQNQENLDELNSLYEQKMEMDRERSSIYTHS